MKIGNQTVMNNEANDQKKKEMHAFFFLTAVVAPVMAVAVVGGYGLLIWLYQMLAGPPVG